MQTPGPHSKHAGLGGSARPPARPPTRAGRPACSSVVGLGPAGPGQLGRGPESPIRGPARSPHLPRARSKPAGRATRPKVCPRSLGPPPRRTDGRRSRARHMAPAPRGFGAAGGGGEQRRGLPGNPASEGSKRPGSYEPAPGPGALAPTHTHPRDWLDGGSGGGGGNPARSASDCPFPLACPSPPRCTLGNVVPAPAFLASGAWRGNYNSRRATREGPDTARSARGEAKLRREAAGASP